MGRRRALLLRRVVPAVPPSVPSAGQAHPARRNSPGSWPDAKSRLSMTPGGHRNPHRPRPHQRHCRRQRRRRRPQPRRPHHQLRRRRPSRHRRGRRPSHRHRPPLTPRLLGSSVVDMTRLQGSLHAMARALAPSKEAFDTPLSPPPLKRRTGACHRALRCLPGRDFHPQAGPACRTQHAPASYERHQIATLAQSTRPTDLTAVPASAYRAGDLWLWCQELHDLVIGARAEAAQSGFDDGRAGIVSRGVRVRVRLVRQLLAGSRAESGQLTVGRDEYPL